MHLKKLPSLVLAAALIAGACPPANALTGVSAWAQSDISAAAAAGLVPGGLSNLSARDNITRAEFCAVAVRLYEAGTMTVAERPGRSYFSDTDDDAVNAAYSLGLVTGRGDGVFDPDATITRQELCVILDNVRKSLPQPAQANADSLKSFPDAGTVAPWARDAVGLMVGGQIMSGMAEADGSVTLSPRRTATREQSLIMALRFQTVFGADTRPVFSENDTAGGTQVSTGQEPPAALPDDPEGNAAPNGQAGGSSQGAADSGGTATPGVTVPVGPFPPIRPDEAFDLTEEEKMALVFGDGGAWYQTQQEAEAAMTKITVPVWRLQPDGSKKEDSATLTVNAALAELYQAVFEEIFNGDEQFPIKDAGSYAWRSNERSEHRWGTAIDLNYDENMECYIDEEGNVTQITTGSCWEPGENPYSIPADSDVVRAFKKYGFSWGGDAWTGKRDYMHFSYFGR